jgi:Glycosyltransferase family 87
VSRLARVAVWAAIPLAFAAGGGLVRRELAAAPARIALDLAQPLIVVTAWGAFGARLFVIFALALTVASAALIGLLVAAARSSREPPLAAVLLCAALALVAALTWPVAFSSDVYAYAAYGDDLLHGRNPYLLASPGLHGAFVDAARWQWGGGSFPACVYGPLFVALAGAVVALSGDSLPLSLVALRVLACLAFLAAIALLDAALRGVSQRGVRVAAFALNPVALWSAAEGHNDVLMIGATLAGFVLLRRGRALWGGLLVGLTPLVKAIGLLAGPPAAALVRTPLARRRFVLGLTLGALAAAALVLPLQLAGLRGLSRHGHYAAQFSLQGVLGVWPALLLAGLIAVAAVRALRAGRAEGAVRLALALWIAIPNPYPWYGLWVLPVAVAGPWNSESLALWGATISVALRYLPDAYGDMGRVPAMLTGIAEMLPLGLALAALRRPPSTSKEASPTR